MDNSEEKKNPWFNWFTGFIGAVVWVAAIVLSLMCNNGFDPFHFIAACCCPVCYLPFGIFCMMKRKGGGTSVSVF